MSKTNKLLRLSEQQNHRCAYCGVVMLHPAFKGPKKPPRAQPPYPAVNWRSYTKHKKMRRATLDHIVPRCDGGTLANDNIVVACKLCNNYRGNQPADVAFSRIQRLVNRKTHPHIVYDKTGRFPIDHFKRLPTIERQP